MFTSTDKALLMRAARQMADAAQLESNSYGQNWAASADARGAKRRYDRLLREERDLRDLARRLETEAKFDAARMASKVPHIDGGGDAAPAAG